MGVGVIAMHDQAGPVKNMMIGGDYSYRLKFSDKVSLLGGIRISLVNHTIAFRDLNVIHENDPNLQQNYTTGFQLNGGWSAALLAGNFFLAVSEPRVRRFNFQTEDNAANFIDAANYYAMTGYNFKTSSLDIEPSVLLRLAENVPVSTDFNLLLRYKKTIDLAMTYRSKSSYGVRAGVLTAQKLYLTYLYEVPAAVGVRAGYQSHELAVKYILGK
jgi:type IX secretion system PorP/SprF family membrane protein